MEPIAIIGMSCRFPGAENPEAFWELLRNGVDAIEETPSQRWEVEEFYDQDPETPGKTNCRYGGYLNQIDQFDPHFFGISPREAMAMDPQQRLLLEVAWEALEDGGQVLSKLAGSKTGVFVGISNNDYSYLNPNFTTQPEGYDLTGNCLNIAAGRLAYSFNLRGPSLAVDTACSSSLVAVHLACQSLWNGEATMALAAGVNLILSPIGHIALSKLKALSPDGRCQAFAAKANGYVRSEGAGCVVLKPLSQALADGDSIYAVVRGSAVNHDGRSKGLTVPYGPAQEAVIRQALAKAQVDPSEISYVEAHGTGTPIGDPIEVMALAAVLGKGRSPENICALGAVKTNIGHLESAAGIASLIKVVLSLKHGQIPPSLHFETPNPYIPFEKLPFKVQTTLTSWTQKAYPAKAGVSSFGFAGTNAHVILEAAPSSSPRSLSSSLPYLLPLSAHTPEALKAMGENYQALLATQSLEKLQNLCYSTSVRRTHQKYRLACLCHNPAELRESLSKALQEASHLASRKFRTNKPVFVFSGQGSQEWGMGRELFAQEPVFRSVIAECDRLIQEETQWSLIVELTADESQSRLNDSEIAQPSLLAIQVALARLWQSWGIEPKAVVGDGLGEVAAAHISGILSLESAVKLICQRGRMMHSATKKELESEITEITAQKERIPFFSTVTGAKIAGTDLGATYWDENRRQPTCFTTAMAALIDAGYQTFIEISPHPVLSATVGQCLSDRGQEGIVLPSLQRGQPERASLLTSLGTLYTLGYEINWEKLYPDGGDVVPLPLYPWQRERYWLEGKPTHKPQKSLGKHPLLGQRLHTPLAEIIFESELSVELQPFLEGHQVYNRVVLPGAVYLELALAATQTALGKGIYELREVAIEEAFILPENQSRILQVILTPQGDQEKQFRIVSRPEEARENITWTQHAYGTVFAPANASEPLPINLTDLKTRLTESLAVKTYYQQLQQRGLYYGASFQGIQNLWRQAGEVLGQLQLPESVKENPYELHPVLMDSALQMLFATLASNTQDTYLPVGVDRLHVYRRPPSSLWCLGSIRPPTENSDIRLGDLSLWDNEGQMVAEIEGLRVKRIPRQALQPSTKDTLSDWLYEVQWQPKPRPGQILAADFLTPPQQVSDRLLPLALELSDRHQLADYDEIFAQLETLSADYVLKTFSQLGIELSPQQRLNTLALTEKFGIISLYHRLFSRMLEMLQEEGILKRLSANDWQVIRTPKPSILAKPTEIMGRYPGYEAEFTLLERCGEKLAPVLQGTCDPIPLLFPDGDLTTAEKLYQDSPGTRTFNLLVQQAIATLLEKLPPGRPLKVLEIGGGTGGTTTYVLPQLPSERTEYVFSDVSHLFMAKAKEKFAAYPFVHYQILDIEQDIEAQGLDLHQFDLILGANVIHATSHLRQTLSHVQDLLTSEGTMILLEGTGKERWLDLIFGLTEGWWKFSDVELRPDYPLLTPSQWQTFLIEIGFSQTAAIPAPDARHGGLSHQAIILGRGAQIQETAPLKAQQPGCWLIFADTQGIGQQVATQLKAQGERCVLIFPGKSYQQIEPAQYILNPNQPSDFQRLFANAIKPDHLPCRGILHLWSLEAVSLEKMTVSDLETTSILGCRSSLHLLQSLVKAELPENPTLWLVTQGAQPVGGLSRPVTLAQSPLWGLGKEINLEHPDLRCVLVDLDPSVGETSGKALFDELWAETSDAETQIALRQNQRYVSRLMRPHPIEAQPLKIQSEGTYLITGGLGGLGLLVAQWLVEQGARNLVLVSRRVASAEANTAIKSMKQLGANIVIAQADVSQTEQLAKVFSQIEGYLPPLKGVIQAAGVLAVDLLARQDWSDFAKVLTPKVQGAWNLHLLTQHLPLDFFILFSSAAALFGSPGQGNHAAANTFLDALAYYRQAQGLPALSINWGAWEQVGIVGNSKFSEMSSMRGMETISPENGLQVLEQIFQTSGAQIGVIPIQWDQFLQPFDVCPPFLAEFARETGGEQTVETATESSLDWLQQGGRSAKERQERLLAFLKEQVTKVLRLSASYALDVQQGFFDLGMDSLTSVELKNRLQTVLGIKLPSTLIFDYPTMDALAQYLASELFTDLEEQTSVETKEPVVEIKGSVSLPISVTNQDSFIPITATEIERLSQEDAEALLLKELESLSY